MIKIKIIRKHKVVVCKIDHFIQKTDALVF